jgi:translation initiation factor 3 subunit L
MSIISDALRQAFMPKHEYESLREEEKVWGKLQRPVTVTFVAGIWLAIIISTVISLKIVFPGSDGKRPLCVDRSVQSVQLGMKGESDSDLFPSAFYLTDQEIADYYWMVVFIPSFIIFALSSLYLIAGKKINFIVDFDEFFCLIIIANRKNANFVVYFHTRSRKIIIIDCM